jgi:hypothetical protein
MGQINGLPAHVLIVLAAAVSALDRVASRAGAVREPVRVGATGDAPERTVRENPAGGAG